MTDAAAFDAACATALDAARAADQRDPLRAFADRFLHPVDAAGRRVTYLCGHSLGLQPASVATLVREELDAWARRGVLGHHDGARPWIPYHERLAPALARLTGAATDEVVAMNSLTVNLHLMMVSFFRPAGARTRILIEASAFPSDRYAVESQLRFHGLDPAQHLVEIGPRAGERVLRTEDLVAAIERDGERLALVLLPGVQYLTGQCLDMAALTAAAHRVGATVGLDLAHAIGNVPLALHDWNVDFAIWCSYKYLNAGPGAIGGCFVHARHGQDTTRPRFAGWWGHDKATRFRMGPDFHPIAGAEGWQLSNPPVLATAPLIASLELFDAATLPRLREKSLALTGRLRELIQTWLADTVEIVTPAEADAHGAQLSLRVKRPGTTSRRLDERLAAEGVIGDWREPDVLRLAPAPLYNSHADVVHAATVLRKVLGP